MEIEGASAAANVAAWHILPPFWTEALNIVLSIALIAGAIAIPGVIYWIGRASQKRRSTIDIIRTLGTAPEVVERMSRLYRYRLYEEAKIKTALSEEKVVMPPDPYEKQEEFSLLFDTVIVLNYYEGICVDVKHEMVDEDLLFHFGKDMLIGARDVILKRYEQLTGASGDEAWPYIGEIADRWHFRARREKRKVSDRISDLKSL